MRQFFPRDFSQSPLEGDPELVTCYKCGGKFDPRNGEIKEFAIRYSSGKAIPRFYCTTTESHKGCLDKIARIPAIPSQNLDLYRRFTIFKNVRK